MTTLHYLSRARKSESRVIVEMSHIFLKYPSLFGRIQACCPSGRLINWTAARAAGSYNQSSVSETGDRDREEEGSNVEMEKDPHLLHAIWRIRSLKRRPYWERRIMKQLQLDNTKKPVIHKNTPHVNALLTRVRHLVRIKPVNPVYGLPDGDYDETLLKWNGDFIVKWKIDAHSEETKTISDGVEEQKSKERSGS